MGITSIRRNLESAASRPRPAADDPGTMSPSVLAELVIRQKDQIGHLQSELNAARGESAQARTGPSDADMRAAIEEIERLSALLTSERLHSEALAGELSAVKAELASAKDEPEASQPKAKSGKR